MGTGPMLVLPPKDPDEVLFYEFDWATKRLDPGEVILSSSWSITQGSVEIVENPAPSEDNGVTKVYLRGGLLGEICIVTNTVVTNLNPQRQFSGKLKIKAK